MFCCRTLEDEAGEAAALSGLGEVYQSMGEFSTALRYHQDHLNISQRLGDRPAQLRAYLNLGGTHEAMKDYDQAKSCHEQCLSIATLVNDRVAKIKALGNLGECSPLSCYLSIRVN